jgi:hypothetical protein
MKPAPEDHERDAAFIAAVLSAQDRAQQERIRALEGILAALLKMREAGNSGGGG